MKNIGIVIIIIGTIIAFTMPAILAKVSLWLDFSDSGQIGDTIGGISGPIINLIGAILVYFSFEEQRKANKLIIDKEEYNNLEKNLEEVKEELRNLKFSTTKLGNLFGEDALSEYCHNVLNYKDDEFENSVIYLIMLMKFFIEKIEESYIPIADKKSVFERFKFLYDYKIEEDLKLITMYNNMKLFTISSSLDSDIKKLNQEYNGNPPKKRRIRSSYTKKSKLSEIPKLPFPPLQ